MWDYAGKISVTEKRFDAAGQPVGESRFSFVAASST
jgi:hypothetical protein